jgi:glucose/mannose-6-phosphate isomerase
MGGSAISGDLLIGCMGDEITVPVIVNRGYEIPGFVDNRSLVFITSYSGNTEETLSIYEQAVSRTDNILCITSGGKLEALKPRHIFRIPDGYQPRCAIGWLFAPMVTALHQLGVIGDKSKELKESVDILSSLSGEFGLDGSSPFRLAEKLVQKLPVIYSDSRFLSVARRWVTQLNENSKQFAHFNAFSELNHNEIVGFGEPETDSVIVILRDRSYSARINLRIELTKELLQPHAGVEEIESHGNSMLARFFSLIYFGDWVSYWLAEMKGIDPTPVKRIDWLKGQLEKRGMSV